MTFLINSLEQGGAERQLAELISGLDAARFEPSLIVCVDKDHLGYTLPVERVHSLSAPLFPTPVSMAQLVRVFREIKPDVVHTFKGIENIAGRLAARAANVRGVVGAVRCPKLSRRELLGEKLTHKLADAIVVNSVGIRDVLLNDAHVPASKVHVVENGVDFAKFAPLTDAEIAAERAARGLTGAFVLVVPGRVSHEKNQLSIVRALAMMKKRGTLPARTKVIFAGRDSLLTYGPMVRATVAALGMGQEVELAGVVKGIASLVGCADAVLLPSFYEGLSNAVVEAMASAVPVIVSPPANMDGLVGDSVEGLVCTGTSHVEIAAALERFVALSNDQRRSMGLRGFAHARRRFTIARMVAGTVAVYERVLGLPGTPSSRPSDSHAGTHDGGSTPRTHSFTTATTNGVSPHAAQNGVASLEQD